MIPPFVVSLFCRLISPALFLFLMALIVAGTHTPAFAENSAVPGRTSSGRSRISVTIPESVHINMNIVKSLQSVRSAGEAEALLHINDRDQELVLSKLHVPVHNKEDGYKERTVLLIEPRY